MDMSDHALEGVGSGWRSPVHALEDVLFCAQTEHASMYSWTSVSIAGHQNLRDMMNVVLLTPGMKAARCEPNESPVDLAQWGQKDNYWDNHEVMGLHH